MIVHVVAFDHVWVVNVAEDLDLAAHLSPDGVLVVAIDHFERVRPVRRPVNHFVDGSAASAADSGDSVQVRKVDDLVVGLLLLLLLLLVTGRRSAVGRGGGRRKRERNRQSWVALWKR